MKRNQPPSFLRILIADDVPKEAKKIEEQLNRLLEDIDYEITSAKSVKDAIDIIEKSPPFDLIVADILFVDEGADEGKKIIDAASNKDSEKITQKYLISARWSLPKILKIRDNYLGARKISKEDNFQGFSEKILLGLDMWSKLKLAKLSTTDKNKLIDSIVKNDLTKNTIINVLNERWKASTLFASFYSSYSNKETAGLKEYIKQQCNIFPPNVLDKQRWVKGSQKFELPLSNYYDELYSSYLPLIDEVINESSKKLLDLIFKCYVFNQLKENMPDDKKYTTLSIQYQKELSKLDELIGGYTARVAGRNGQNRIPKGAMLQFFQKLIGRQVYLAMYIYLDFSPQKVTNILMTGDYGCEEELYGNNIRGLYNTSLFLAQIVSTSGTKKWRKLDQIIELNCTSYELDFLKNWWKESNWLLNKNLGLSSSDVEIVNTSLNSHIRWITT